MRIYLRKRLIYNGLIFVAACTVIIFINLKLYSKFGGSQNLNFDLDFDESWDLVKNGLQEYEESKGFPPVHRQSEHHYTANISRHGEEDHGAYLRTPTDPLHVYVFEEHHEALPYWFDAAYKDRIPRQGNTLIHIDGHSDLAPPTYFEQYPFFRWPLAHELKYLMQKNDIFIQVIIIQTEKELEMCRYDMDAPAFSIADDDKPKLPIKVGAGMAGLFSRVIWIWPDWDRVNHEGKYSMYRLSMGWAAVNDTENPGQKMKAFCMCQQNGTKYECRYLDEMRDAPEGIEMPKEKCHIKTSIIVEEVHEKTALSYLSKDDWFHKSENVILDIDEDFYGCSFAIMPLLNTNVSMARLKSMNNFLDAMFCPKTTAEEKGADSLLLEMISAIIDHKSCLSEEQKSMSSSKCTSKALKTKVEDILINGFYNKESHKCTPCITLQDQVKKLTNRLLIKLHQLTSKQLQMLQKVGFCRVTSPKSFQLYGASAFGICYGANTPEETAVITHLPDREEIMRRSILLMKMLNRMKKFTPQLVTLCRSMRDGYTPRLYFDQIEKDILTALNGTYDKNVKVHYDIDLMGGKKGWPAWHKY